MIQDPAHGDGEHQEQRDGKREQPPLCNEQVLLRYEVILIGDGPAVGRWRGAGECARNERDQDVQNAGDPAQSGLIGRLAQRLPRDYYPCEITAARSGCDRI